MLRRSTFFEALCVEWWNSAPGFCFSIRAKKCKYKINNNSFPELGSSPQPSRYIQLYPCASAPRRLEFSSSFLNIRFTYSILFYFRRCYYIIELADRKCSQNYTQGSLYILTRCADQSGPRTHENKTRVLRINR